MLPILNPIALAYHHNDVLLNAIRMNLEFKEKIVTVIMSCSEYSSVFIDHFILSIIIRIDDIIE